MTAFTLEVPEGAQDYGALAVIRIPVPGCLNEEEARKAAEAFCRVEGLDVVTIASVARSGYRRVYDLTTGREIGKV